MRERRMWHYERFWRKRIRKLSVTRSYDRLLRFSVQISVKRKKRRSFSKNEVAKGLKIGGFKKRVPSEKMTILFHFFAFGGTVIAA